MGLSWEPERRVMGSIYCSPACGRGCTRQEYLNADKAGLALATRLGGDWTWKVWENLGWYHKAVSACGRIKVHPAPGCGGFAAFLGEAGSPGGRWVEQGSTPQEAVDAVVAAGRETLDEVAALLEGL